MYLKASVPQLTVFFAVQIFVTCRTKWRCWRTLFVAVIDVDRTRSKIHNETSNSCNEKS